MNFQIVKQVTSAILICGFLAACQTTGLTPGSVETRFPVTGWEKAQRGSNTIYVCTVCKSLEIIVTGPAKVTGNAESAVRADILSVGLLSEVDKSVARLSKGAIKVQSRRKIATQTYSGFEFVYRIQAPGKKPLYMAARSIIQRDKGMQVSSYAVSATKAKANLRKFMANTTIKRLP